MKSFIYTLILFLNIYTIQAQELGGYWLGSIDVQGQKLRIAFNISLEEGTFKTTMDSPDQKAKGIPTQTKSMTPENIEVQIPNMAVIFKGKLSSASIIDGTFTQGSMSFPLILNKEQAPTTGNVRPQTPKKPYLYHSEDVNFKNSKANIHLAATLTKPNKKGKFPAVILISGSGPQNRNEEIMDHKPFLVLADYLTKQGYAVLRYDDRGTYESEGNFNIATSEDFATDVGAAIDYLKARTDINSSKIGLIGHSEGGLIAPMVSSQRSDLAFLILLAGTGVKGKFVIADQIEAINRANGESEEDNLTSTEISRLTFDYLETIQDKKDKQELLSSFMKDLLKKYDNFKLPSSATEEQFIQAQVTQLCSPWMIFFLFYNPGQALKSVKCPTLAINGSKDLQVTSQLNLLAIKNALKHGEAPSFKTLELPGLNHLFQECKTGSPNEYERIEQTFSPVALKAISDWMTNLNL